MTNNIAKIRAALEQAGDYISSDLASERGAFEGYEGVSRIDEIKADLANNVTALAALAKLEKSSGRSSARMSWEVCGCQTPPTHYVGTMPCPLNTTPPPVKPAIASAPQFVAGEVARRVWNRAYDLQSECGEDTSAHEESNTWLTAWRAELGPALGLVEIREPSDEQCRDIWREAKANEGDGSKVCAGRAMFDAVRAVMWPKSEAK